MVVEVDEVGPGGALWSDLRRLEDGCDVTAETAETGTVHVTFRRRRS